MSDSYTGAVDVGGPMDVRRLPGLTIAKLAVGPMNNNAYLLRCTQTDEGLLIDAANEPERLRELITFEGPPVSAILTTHQHFDHWQALPELVAATGAPVAAHPLDADALPVDVAHLVEDGGTVTVGDCTLEAIHLVGHTPGSIALLYQGPDRPHLFSGDCLFPGGVGNTQDDKDRFTSLINDVSTKVFDRLPDETWVYPGHGNDTTLGAERPHLQEWRDRGW